MSLMEQKLDSLPSIQNEVCDSRQASYKIMLYTTIYLIYLQLLPLQIPATCFYRAYNHLCIVANDLKLIRFNKSKYGAIATNYIKMGL